MDLLSNALIPWAALLLALASGIGTRKLRRWQRKEILRLENAAKAYDDHDRAFDLLEQWEEARPFLRVGQCPYAQSLVLEMIHAYERIQRYDPSADWEDWWLEYLHELLQDVPPPRIPPFISEPQHGLAFLLGRFSPAASCKTERLGFTEKRKRGGASMTEASQDFRKQLAGYGLTTAHIEYYNPDAPRIINPHPLIWQEYDVWPEFPALAKYLDFWQKEIDGKLHRVIVAHARLIKPSELRHIGDVFKLH